MADTSSDKKHLTNVQLITCVVQRGKGEAVAKAAMKAGAPAATVYFARGTGIRERLGLLRIAISPEKEVIDIVISDDKANAVFDAMVSEGKLDTPGMGFIYMIPVSRAFPVFSP
jgi:nitrogen regulatory protein PII